MNTAKRLTLLLALLLSLTLSHAADISLNFTISNENTTPDSVWVYNTNQDTAIMLDGTATLALVSTAASLESHTAQRNSLQLYPNPTSTTTTLAYTAQYSGTHRIGIIDMTGRTIASYTATLSQGTHQFALPTLAAGNYCVSVSNTQQCTTSILMSQYQGNSSRKITLIGNDEASGLILTKTASTTTNATLPYDLGDQLQLIAYLDAETDTLTLAPQANQTVDFDITLPPTADELLMLEVEALNTTATALINEATADINSAETSLDALLQTINNGGKIVETDYQTAEATIEAFDADTLNAAIQEIKDQLPNFEDATERAKAQTMVDTLEALLATAEATKATCETKLQTAKDSIVPEYDLDGWKNANFEARANITISEESHSLIVDSSSYDDFVTAFATITVEKESGFEDNIELGFDGVDLDNSDLENLVNSGQGFEIVERTGYTLLGEVKSYLIEKAFNFTENKILDATGLANMNVNNSNFSNLIIDFSDENNIFTDMSKMDINIYANTFGKIDAKGFNWNGRYNCDYYAQDVNFETNNKTLYSMDNVFNVVGEYGVDWTIESMEMVGGNIIEHASMLEKLEANTSMTEADILDCIESGKISIAYCDARTNIADGIDKDGYFVPYIKTAIEMAGNQIEMIGLSTDDLGENHPKAGGFIKVNSDVVKQLIDLLGSDRVFFRQLILTGDDLVFEDGTVTSFKYSIIDLNIDGGGALTDLELSGCILTPNAQVIKDASTSTSCILTEGCDVQFEGSTYFRFVISPENDDRIRNKIAGADVLDITVEKVDVPIDVEGIATFIADFENDTSYTVIAMIEAMWNDYGFNIFYS